MLAWRGKPRDDLLAALRQVQAASAASGAPASRPALDVPARPAGRGARVVLVARAEPGPAARADRRARPGRPRPATAHVPPAPVPVRGQDLADVLAPAYQRFAAAPEPPAEP